MNEKQLAMQILMGPTYAAVGEKASLEQVLTLLQSGIRAEDLTLLEHITQMAVADGLDPLRVAEVLKKLAEI